MTSALLDAVLGGDIGEVSFIVEAGVSINALFQGGTTPLNTALSFGYMDIAKLLLYAGANPGRPDPFSVDECCRCPAHYTAAIGDETLMDTIMISGVNVDVTDFGHATPLHHAASAGHLSMVKYLLKAGANINHQSKSGRTALWKAATNGHLDIVKHLIKSGANVNTQDRLGSTVIFDLVSHSHCTNLRIACELIQHGLDVNIRDMSRDTALHTSACIGNAYGIELLIRSGCNVNVKNEGGHTPLHSSAQHGYVKATALLLNHGAKVTTKNSAGQSALYVAILHTKLRTTSLLLQAGALLSAPEKRMLETFETSRYVSKERFLDFVTSHLIHIPKPLKYCCRITIRGTLSDSFKALQLPLPSKIKDFLLFQEFF